MTFLDSSAIIDYLDGDRPVVRFVDEKTEPPYLTASLCVYEVLMGAVHAAGGTDVDGTRAEFGWVSAVDVTESVAVESARLQRTLSESGAVLSPRDALVAGAARSTGHRLVATDDDFDDEPLRRVLDVARPARG
ncbi:MAG: PIN domain-containing protein [Halobacteriales archaeon]